MGGDAHVDEGAGPECVDFVESEFFSGADGFVEVGDERRGIGEGIDFFSEVGDVGFETRANVALGPFDEGCVFVAVFAVEDDFAAVRVGVFNSAPGADCVGVLRVGIDFDGDGGFLVLAEDVLNGIEVVLAHIAKASAIVIPVTAEGLMSAVRVVGFFWSGPEPEVVIEVIGNRLFYEVGAADPAEFPIESGGSGDGDFEGPAEQAVHGSFFEVDDGCPHAVEAGLEAEPGIEAEHAFLFFDHFHHGDTLTDGAAVGFFAPDVLAGLRGGDRHGGVPMGWGGDVDDVDVVAGDEFAEIAIAGDVVFRGFGLIHACLEVIGIDVAECQQPAGHRKMRAGDAATADDAFGDFVGRGGLAVESEQAAGDDLDGGQGGEGFESLAASLHDVDAV